MDVRFLDTTFRDGSQSLWASGMRTGMIEAVAGIMDQAGFDAIEVPANAIYFKKFVRDLKEDPWEMARMVARKMPNTVKSCMAGALVLKRLSAKVKSASLLLAANWSPYWINRRLRMSPIPYR